MTALDRVVFDLNGTLFDPAGLSAELPAPLNDDRTGRELLDETVQQAMWDTMLGRYRPFGDYLRAAADRRLRLGGGPDSEAVERVVAAAGQLPVFAEVPEALRELASAGLEIAAITNSGSEVAESSLRAAGILDRFTAVVGSDVTRAYKPAPAVYRTGLERLGADPARTCMVAAHGWDLHGAKAAGMRTAWVGRVERVLLESLGEPDFRGADVLDACRAVTSAA